MSQTCHHCKRPTATTNGRRYLPHRMIANTGDNCPMEYQIAPIRGRDAEAHEQRIDLVLDLAHQIQDADPTLVWTYLASVPADELKLLMMAALCGLDIGSKSRHELFGWLGELPAARCAS